MRPRLLLLLILNANTFRASGSIDNLSPLSVLDESFDNEDDTGKFASSQRFPNETIPLVLLDLYDLVTTGQIGHTFWEDLALTNSNIVRSFAAKSETVRTHEEEGSGLKYSFNLSALLLGQKPRQISHIELAEVRIPVNTSQLMRNVSVVVDGRFDENLVGNNFTASSFPTRNPIVSNNGEWLSLDLTKVVKEWLDIHAAMQFDSLIYGECSLDIIIYTSQALQPELAESRKEREAKEGNNNKKRKKKKKEKNKAKKREGGIVELMQEVEKLRGIMSSDDDEPQDIRRMFRKTLKKLRNKYDFETLNEALLVVFASEDDDSGSLLANENFAQILSQTSTKMKKKKKKPKESREQIHLESEGENVEFDLDNLARITKRDTLDKNIRRQIRRAPSKKLKNKRKRQQKQLSALFRKTWRLDICRRQDFVVKWSDIGWEKWILYPKKFNAYYCVGRCNAPNNGGAIPTNHAIIQAIIHLLKPETASETVCVPTKYTTISVMYFEEGKIVVKNHKQMVAEECGCA